MSRGLNDFMPQSGDLGSEDHLPDRPTKTKKSKPLSPASYSTPADLNADPSGAGVKYPEITVQLVGNDGNAFMVLGLTKKALQQGGASKEEIDAFWKEATSGDYDHLLMVVQQWVNVE